MRKLTELLVLCVFGVIGTFLVLEWFAGCGETYIDSKGVRHAHECFFVNMQK